MTDFQDLLYPVGSQGQIPDLKSPSICCYHKFNRMSDFRESLTQRVPQLMVGTPEYMSNQLTVSAQIGLDDLRQLERTVLALR